MNVENLFFFCIIKFIRYSKFTDEKTKLQGIKGNDRFFCFVCLASLCQYETRTSILEVQSYSYNVANKLNVREYSKQIAQCPELQWTDKALTDAFHRSSYSLIVNNANKAEHRMKHVQIFMQQQ